MTHAISKEPYETLPAESAQRHEGLDGTENETNHYICNGPYETLPVDSVYRPEVLTSLKMTLSTLKES